MARSYSLALARSIAVLKRAGRLGFLGNDTAFPPVALEVTNMLSNTLVWLRSCWQRRHCSVRHLVWASCLTCKHGVTNALLVLFSPRAGATSEPLD